MRIFDNPVFLVMMTSVILLMFVIFMFVWLF